jgi:tetratricopeptide (TPR) repeat protein
MKNWEEAVRRNAFGYEAHRCLAIAYYDKRNDRYGALNEMEIAFRLHKDPRYLFELVQIYKAAGKPAAERLTLLEKHADLLDIRNDLYTEYVALLNLNGNYDKAALKLKEHIFHPYEGGEGILMRQHILTYIELGRAAYTGGDYEEAKRQYLLALEYPENYGEGRQYLAHEAHIYYHLALAAEKLGDTLHVKVWLEKAVFNGDDYEEPGFYKGLALRKLGRAFEAQAVFRSMLDWAEEGLEDPDAVLYFPAFPAGLPFDQTIRKVNTRRYLYARLLGSLGLGDSAEFRKTRETLASLTDNTPWVSIVVSDIEEP